MSSYCKRMMSGGTGCIARSLMDDCRAGFADEYGTVLHCKRKYHVALSVS